MKKKFLSCLLVLCMMLSLLPITTVFASEIVDSGTCGENLTWSLDSDEVLTVSGTGDMTEAPYKNNRRLCIFRYEYQGTRLTFRTYQYRTMGVLFL